MESKEEEIEREQPLCECGVSAFRFVEISQSKNALSFLLLCSDCGKIYRLIMKIDEEAQIKLRLKQSGSIKIRNYIN